MGRQDLHASTNDAASMMKDGQLDVALWIGPGEAFIVQDMMNSVDLDILPVDENVIKAVGESTASSAT